MKILATKWEAKGLGAETKYFCISLGQLNSKVPEDHVSSLWGAVVISLMATEKLPLSHDQSMAEPQPPSCGQQTYQYKLTPAYNQTNEFHLEFHLHSQVQ